MGPTGPQGATGLQGPPGTVDPAVLDGKVDVAGDTMTGALTLSVATDILTTTTPATPASGRAQYRRNCQGLDALAWMNTLGVPLVITRDRVFYAKNSTGATLTKGTGVYISGATGATPLIAKARSGSDACQYALRRSCHCRHCQQCGRRGDDRRRSNDEHVGMGRR